MSHRTRSFSPPSRLSCWGRIFCRVVVLGFVTAVAYAQDVPLDPSAQNPPGARTGAAGATPDPQPYDKVITKDAKSKKGAFTVHEITEKYYYEIPRRELDKVFLWNTQIAKTVEGAGYGGQELSARVVRWELNRNSVHLPTTTAHLEGARDQIAKILDPKFNPATGIGVPISRPGLDDLDRLSGVPGLLTACWPDDTIRP